MFIRTILSCTLWYKQLAIRWSHMLIIWFDFIYNEYYVCTLYSVHIISSSFSTNIAVTHIRHQLTHSLVYYHAFSFRILVWIVWTIWICVFVVSYISSVFLPLRDAVIGMSSNVAHRWDVIVHAIGILFQCFSKGNQVIIIWFANALAESV